MYYTNHWFRNFVEDTGKGVFVDADFHPKRWYLFNMGDVFYSYFWAIVMLPLFLGKSSYSEELIAYARQAKITHHNDYLNCISSFLEPKRRSAQAAVKAYLRRVDGGRT
ncbi:hypothetical protein CVT25_006171 [Psilocybe cyanescens]|uniref:Uncharacterized protein n=1 Tax=Psilocybe cyanescens TaxID=93625 RepID=A0A409XIL7_PSICY|nr:hypothetical protein CVT25_006171 [Psilocybe cyanescens]